MTWFATHHDVRVDTLDQFKLVEQRLQSREALLVALVRCPQRLRLSSKRGAGVDVDAIRRLQVLLNPWSRDSRVGSHKYRDHIFHGRKTCVPLFASAVVVDKVHLCDLPALEILSPGPASAYLCAATDLLLFLLVELAPCRKTVYEEQSRVRKTYFVQLSTTSAYIAEADNQVFQETE